MDDRLAVAHLLVDNNIPVVSWKEDALDFVHRVPTALSDLTLLVSDANRIVYCWIALRSYGSRRGLLRQTCKPLVSLSLSTSFTLA